MNTTTRALVLATLSAALLVACNRSAPPADPGTATPASGPQTVLGRTVDRAMAKAREEMATANIDITDITVSFDNNRRTTPRGPKAEITPEGDLLVEGTPVAIDAQQRQQLVTYRGQVIGLAETGMSLGVRGADLGMKAMGEAMKGIFSGNTDQIERNIQAEAQKIKGEARALCEQLGLMRDTQQALAASLPAFAPYANLSQDDVDKCMRHADEQGLAVTSDGGPLVVGGEAVSRDRIRNEVRDGIRQSIRSAAQSAASATGAGSSATLDGVRFLLPAGSVEVDSSNGVGRIDAGGNLLVRVEGGSMTVNGVRYAAPARGAVVNLRDAGRVQVDGQTVAPLQ